MSATQHLAGVIETQIKPVHLRWTTVLPVLFAAAMLPAWQMLTIRLHVSSVLLVPPSYIWHVLVQTRPTRVNTFVGFLMASVLGIALGGALALLIIRLGMRRRSRLAFTVFLSFFPIAVSAATGRRPADKTAPRLCQSLPATTCRTFHRLLAPYAIPHLFAELKVGVTVAIIGVVISEVATALKGPGYIIMFASSTAQTALVFAAIALLCDIGPLTSGAVAIAELLVRRWYGPLIDTCGLG